MERITYFAEVILPLPLEGSFTYRIPHEYANQVKTGQRVVVQFGKRKFIPPCFKCASNTSPEI